MMGWGAKDALVLVDVQNDFLPGGSVPVRGGDEVVPILNAYVAMALQSHAQVMATRDWHPARHCSFRDQGGPWPPHCVQGTHGAELAPGLRLPRDAPIVSKGADPDRDAYSGFDGTALDAALRVAGIQRLIVGGLATDYCVLHTVRDALARGYAVVLLEDAVRGVDPATSLAARDEMRALGAVTQELTAER